MSTHGILEMEHVVDDLCGVLFALCEREHIIVPEEVAHRSLEMDQIQMMAAEAVNTERVHERLFGIADEEGLFDNRVSIA